MTHAERKLPVGRRADRHPLFRLGCRDGKPWLHGHAAHAPLHARIRHPARLRRRMQMRGETVTGAVVQPEIAVLRVIGRRKCRVHIAVDRMIGAAAHGAAGLEEVEIAEGQWPDPDIHLLEIFQRRDDAARIGLQTVLELVGHQRQGFIPADRHPLRVYVRPLLRVRPLQRLREPVGIVVPHDRGIALRTELAAVRGIGRVTLDLVDDAIVGDVNQVRAGMQAHLAGGTHPAAGLDGVVHCVWSGDHC